MLKVCSVPPVMSIWFLLKCQTIHFSVSGVVFTHQSNSLEYTVLAKASRFKAADSGSSGFVMLPSGVTITRLQSESSSIFSLHLRQVDLSVSIAIETVQKGLMLRITSQRRYMSSSAAV